MEKNLFLFSCEIHGETKADVIQVLNDKVNGTITFSISCSLCNSIKKQIKEVKNEKR